MGEMADYYLEQALDNEEFLAYWNSPQGRKYRRHAMAYGAGPRTYADHVKSVYRIRGARSGRVHYLPWFTKGNHEFGAAYGYDRESERTFQSSRIAYAVRKTIDEHYETRPI